VLSVKTARDAGVYLTQQTFQLGQFADGFTDGITFLFNGPGYTEIPQNAF
jgi:hypothetical protein